MTINDRTIFDFVSIFLMSNRIKGLFLSFEFVPNGEGFCRVLPCRRVAVFSLRRGTPVESVVGHIFGNLRQKDVCVTIHDKIALGNRTLPCRLVCLAQTLAIRDIGVFSRANIAMVNEVHRSI
jgi:hypothetical protein